MRARGPCDGAAAGGGPRARAGRVRRAHQRRPPLPRHLGPGAARGRAQPWPRVGVGMQGRTVLGLPRCATNQQITKRCCQVDCASFRDGRSSLAMRGAGRALAAPCALAVDCKKQHFWCACASHTGGSAYVRKPCRMTPEAANNALMRSLGQFHLYLKMTFTQATSLCARLYEHAACRIISLQVPPWFVETQSSHQHA